MGNFIFRVEKNQDNKKGKENLKLRYKYLEAFGLKLGPALFTEHIISD